MTPSISLVSTLFHSSQTIDSFIRQCEQSLDKITTRYEIVLIDDGSPDDSVEKALKYDGPIKIVSLSRNHGHHQAMKAAIEHAKGDFVFLIDSDLENLHHFL